MKKEKNRWLIAASAVGIHLCIGSVYAYSVMVNPLEKLHGWGKTEISFAFSLAILFLGLSAAFLGRIVEEKGPRFSGRLSAAFYSLGILGTGLSIDLGSTMLFYLAYGVFGGVGLGLGYITPVSTLVKWFPDRRGLATGLAIMGFGFGALIFGPIMAKLFVAISIPSTFYALGVLYFVVMNLSAWYLEPPEKGWLPMGMRASEKGAAKVSVKADLAQMTAKEALGTPRFYYLWLMLFINVTCGIAVISAASPMLQEILGMSAASAAAVVGLNGLFNGVGRIFWASLSDKLGRSTVYSVFFALQIILFLSLPNIKSAILFQVVFFAILTCYGGGFSCVPAFIGDVFGTKELARIHGYILTAWSAAGIVGPTIASMVREQTSSYMASFSIFSGFFVVALIISAMMKIDITRIEKQLQLRAV
jgi:OFA family oxalate/formate antiporter-like MFS transporter